MVTARVALGSGALLALAAGCGGAASNADWIRTAESGAVVADAPVAFEPAATSNDTLSELEPSAGRQRLDHTVTLGEVFTAPPGAAPASTGGSSTTVIVNVSNTQPAYYGGYGYGYGALAGSGRGDASRPAASPHHGGSAAVIPGQSWPAAPSYGPSFPYSTSPASPWEHKR